MITTYKKGDNLLIFSYQYFREKFEEDRSSKMTSDNEFNFEYSEDEKYKEFCKALVSSNYKNLQNSGTITFSSSLATRILHRGNGL